MLCWQSPKLGLRGHGHRRVSSGLGKPYITVTLESQYNNNNMFSNPSLPLEEDKKKSKQQQKSCWVMIIMMMMMDFMWGWTMPCRYTASKQKQTSMNNRSNTSMQVAFDWIDTELASAGGCVWSDLFSFLMSAPGLWLPRLQSKCWPRADLCQSSPAWVQRRSPSAMRWTLSNATLWE